MMGSPLKLLAPYALLCLLAIPTLSHGNEPMVYAQTALPSMPPDGWGGYKAHVGISAVFGIASRSIVRDPVKAWGLCMVPGVIKEVADYKKDQPGYRHGLFSRKDLVSDGIGCAVGVSIGGVMFAPGRVWFTKEF